MAESIGYRVVKTLSQKRYSVHHSHCIGVGKLEELKKFEELKKKGVI